MRRLTNEELDEMRRIALRARQLDRQLEEVPDGWESHSARDILALVEEVSDWRAIEEGRHD